MKPNPSNRVKMIGPKGKISYVSRRASQSVHAANLGFMIADDQGPEFDEGAPFAAPNASTGDQKGPLGFKLNTRTDAGKA